MMHPLACTCKNATVCEKVTERCTENVQKYFRRVATKNSVNDDVVECFEEE